MRTFALVLLCTAPAFAQVTDEYIPPPPETHNAEGVPYCDTLPPPAPDGDRAPAVCAQRPSQVINGAPTYGSPWQVEILSTFAYTDQVVAADRRLRAGEGKVYLAEKAPWERTHRCGGALIDWDLILTAAHCVWPKTNGDVLRSRAVRVGTDNLASGQGRVVRIAQAVVHAGYDTATAANDIALVRLDWGRTISLIPTIPLAGPGQPDARPGRRVSVTGWGLTGARDPGGDAMLTRAGEVNHASAQLQQLWLAVQPGARVRRRAAVSGGGRPGHRLRTGGERGRRLLPGRQRRPADAQLYQLDRPQDDPGRHRLAGRRLRVARDARALHARLLLPGLDRPRPRRSSARCHAAALSNPRLRAPTTVIRSAPGTTGTGARR